MRSLVLKPRAILDLMQIADYYDARNPKVADKFEIKFKITTARLVQYPRAGSPVKAAFQGFKKLRRCTIEGFPNWSLFYSVKDKQVEVVRVMHGARNIPRELRKRS
jgi:toxin ParE1/3/4